MPQHAAANTPARTDYWRLRILLNALNGSRAANGAVTGASTRRTCRNSIC
jgi:hypothetical protein